MIEEGDFSFVTDHHFKRLFEDAYNAIHVANSWDFIAEGCDTLSFSEYSAPELYEIASYMNMRIFNYATFEFVMEEMNYIALYGWHSWVYRIKKLNTNYNKI